MGNAKRKNVARPALDDVDYSLSKDAARKRASARNLGLRRIFSILETALARIRQDVKRHIKNHRYVLHRNLLTPFREKLGFEFTAPQRRVIREIFDDLMKPEPMNRLLQGDVGSGKTVVALSAMLLAVENGGQAALMAPTEILAEQHALTFAKFLKHLPIRMALISGHQSLAQKKKALEEIAAGRVDIVIGTHALIQKRVQFKELTLAVIDEQHRFGVEHRGFLREKGGTPDILVMTATPIPMNAGTHDSRRSRCLRARRSSTRAVSDSLTRHASPKKKRTARSEKPSPRDKQAYRHLSFGRGIGQARTGKSRGSGSHDTQKFSI